VKKRIVVLGLLFILLTGISLTANTQDINYPEVDGVFNCDEYEVTMKVEDLEMEIGWLTRDGNLMFAVKSVGKGWVAVGFDPTTMMRNANIIIGDVTEDGTINIEDHFGVANTAHRKDDENNILQAAGTENEDGTVLEFVIPLNSGDDMDRVLELGQEYKVILAYHMSDDGFKIRHSNRTSVNITF
jgi:tetrahydromethanopterin S-methyltransferase subunit F